MMQRNLGVSFRESMAGPFALGAVDPYAGAQQGKANGAELAMYASVFIGDLDRFIADREHPGSLTGTIDFAPLGERIQAKSGVFNLFSLSDNPRVKLMVYELAFEHQGEDYYLAGHKEVRDDPGLDVWSDTTTLYTTLHKGCDKTGLIVGAGILTLSVGGLVKMLSTMRVTNAESAADQSAALTRFGRFFMGELWDKYAAKATPAS